MNIEASQSYAGRKLIKILGSNHIVILQCWVLYKYRIQAYFGYLSTNESPQLSGLWRIVLAELVMTRVTCWNNVRRSPEVRRCFVQIKKYHRCRAERLE
jgi:hypothetical protein